MPRLKRVPAYCPHKPSGQARVIIDGEHIYLGPFGSVESREKYARLIAQHFAPGTDSVAEPNPAGNSSTRYPVLPVNELLVRYLQFAQTYYVRDGQPTGELDNLKDAMGPLRALYGSTPAGEFGPRALKLVRQHMISQGSLSRRVINNRIDRIKRIYKWAVSEELVPPSIYEGLRAVAGLRFARCDAREAEPVRPVPDEWVEATLRFLPPQVADMVRLQKATGMRSGNLVLLRPRDLDRSGKIWLFEPEQHKTRHHGRRLQILIGPLGQAILQPYLTDRAPDAFIFSPIEAQAWRTQQRQLMPRQRKTPLYLCEIERVQRKKEASRRRKHSRAPEAHYTTDSYRRAIAYAIKKAGNAGTLISSWFPLQLRHSKATAV
jgi:integrase